MAALSASTVLSSVIVQRVPPLPVREATNKKKGEFAPSPGTTGDNDDSGRKESRT